MKNLPRITFRFSLYLLFLISFQVLVFTQTLVTPDGIRLEARLKLEKDSMILGETGFLRFEIENFSDHNLYIRTGGDYRNEYGRPDSYKVTVTRSDGEDVSQPKVKYWQGGLVGAAEIPAHGTYVERLFLPHWGIFEKPDTYTVTVTREFRPEHREGQPSYEFPVNVSTRLKMRPYDDAEMQKLIDSLGQTMLAADPEGTFFFDSASYSAARILASVNDRRVIPYFDRAMTVFGGSSEISDQRRIAEKAAHALSKFSEDAAVEALERAIKSPTDDLRMAVAEALTSSKHPKALKLLISMRSDKYWFVRLRVVQGLGQIVTEESSAYLRGMLNDENEEVRKQTKRYLDNRRPDNAKKSP